MEKVYQEERVCNLENQLRAVSSQFENQNAYFMSLGSIRLFDEIFASCKFLLMLVEKLK